MDEEKQARRALAWQRMLASRQKPALVENPNDPVIILRADMGQRGSPRTHQSYLWLVGRFRDFTGIKDTYTRQDVLGFLDYLVTRKSSRSTVRTAYSALKRLFRAMDTPWPLAREDAPPSPSPRGQKRLTFTPEAIAELVKAARETSGPVVPPLALSTIYGLRQAEILMVRQEDIDLTGMRLRVQLAKDRGSGEVRTHLIPEEIAPRLTLWIPQSVGELNLTFRELRDSLFADLNGYGFHAIRRALVGGLLEAGHSDANIRNFMRWKQESRDMLSRYDTRELEVDRVILARHPFLEFWK